MSAAKAIMKQDQYVDKRTYSVPEIAGMLQISKSKAYDLCKANLFSVIKIGKSVRVSKTSFDAWLDNSGN